MSEWYFSGDTFVNCGIQDKQTEVPTNSIYEVIRVVGGIPLFIEDHYNRFLHSANQLNIPVEIGLIQLKQIIYELGKLNARQAGNVKFELQIFNNDRLNFVLGFIPHSYPDHEMYTNGVKLVSHEIERANPHVKQSVVNTSVRNKIAQVQKDSDSFEVLLINQNMQITEGSRTNILFIEGDKLVSCSTELILEGITRKKIIEICNKSEFEFVEREIAYSQLAKFDSCFLTGTSPKVLPIKLIDKVKYSLTNKLSSYFINAYNQLIVDYCTGYSI